jgi:hypothetical protein
MKLGVFSNERLHPWVNWTTLGPPFLHPLAARESARLIAPPPWSLKRTGEWRETFDNVRTSDALFWMQGASRPELPILAPALLRGNVRRSAFVVDAWKHLITKIGTLAVLQRLDPCFVAFREGRDELRRRFPRGRFEWLPFGVDTDVFDAASEERPVFAYWMGRRYEALHQAMVAYCAARNLTYRYTLRSGEFSDPAELGRLVGSARYFIVSPPDVADPQRTGGFSPFVMRYLEGLAAGARLLGVLPRSGEYERLLPIDAILLVKPDGSDLAARLDADRDDAKGWEAVSSARMLVRDQHSWARRADQVFHRLRDGTATGFADE